MEDREKKYAYWLGSLPGIGNQSINKLLEVCGGTPKSVYEASDKLWKEVLRVRQWEAMKEFSARWDMDGAYQKMVDEGISFFCLDDVQYPKRLRRIPDAPYCVFCKGRMPKEQNLSVAMIGARDCSEYGAYVATQLGRYLGEMGVQIISGMARGIDCISQEAALAAGGTSFAVLGSGVDVCYPAQNKKLYEALIVKGGILSTYPPGTLPKAQHFPPRNRIVSGLADVVVVIEARNKSGTLITVDMALEQGKEVYVVPGRITDRLSDGCNKLMKQGAAVLLSPEEFLEEIGGIRKEREVNGGSIESLAEVKDKNLSKLPKDLAQVYAALDYYPKSLEEILGKLPDYFTHIKLNTALLRLCVEKHALQVSPGFFCRCAEQNSILL